MIDWEDFEPSVEEGGSTGSALALYHPGHGLDPDEVLAAGRAFYEEHAYEAGQYDHALPERPQEVWLRKIPMRDEDGQHSGWMLHQEQREPGRGATPVTVFRWISTWSMQPCGGWPSIRCNGPVILGVPTETIVGMEPGGTLMLCRAHYADYAARMAVAREKALAEYKAKAHSQPSGVLAST